MSLEKKNHVISITPWHHGLGPPSKWRPVSNWTFVLVYSCIQVLMDFEVSTFIMQWCDLWKSNDFTRQKGQSPLTLKRVGNGHPGLEECSWTCPEMVARGGKWKFCSRKASSGFILINRLPPCLSSLQDNS